MCQELWERSGGTHEVSMEMVPPADGEQGILEKDRTTAVTQNTRGSIGGLTGLRIREQTDRRPRHAC